MGKMESILKSEISRLARREIRPLVNPMRRQLRSLLREVVVLRRQTSRMVRTTSRLEQAQMEHVGELSVPEPELQRARMSPGLIKKLRGKLGITQGQLAALIDASAAAVQSWEQGIARPGGTNKASIVALRKLGRRDVAKLLEDKGIGKPGRKPRTELPAKAAKAPKAKKAKRGRKAKRVKKAAAGRRGRRRRA